MGARPAFAALEGFSWQSPRSEEYFADSYALCALHRRLARTTTTGYGFRVNPSLHRRICSLIRTTYMRWQETPPAAPRGQTLVPPS
jgi:hypothetical protein